MTTPTPSALSLRLLTFDGVAQRAEGVRYYLLSPQNTVTGQLYPSGAATLSNDSNRTIKRTLSGLVFGPAECVDINPLIDRIKPVWALEDGTEWPLGVFLFADFSKAPYSGGLTAEGSMVDQGLILDQPLDQSVSFPTGTAVAGAIQTIANGAGIFDIEAAASPRLIGEPVTWGAGRATSLQVVNDLCALADYYPAWFDNRGVLQIRDAQTGAPAAAHFDYDAPPRVTAGSILESDDILEAPNAWVVIDTAAKDSPVVGRYELPHTAPNSKLNRGFTVRKTVEMQGLESVAVANMAAKTAAEADLAIYSSAQFDAPADPRHDTFQVLLWEGQLWREQSWSLEMKAGGKHSHTMTRLWAP